MIRTFTGIVAGSAALCLSACTTAELEAISQGLAQASYDMQYSPYGSTGYGSATPYGAGATNYDTTQWVGYNECVNTGSFYQCDTNGDGYVDMFGNTDTGEMTSSSLKVNGRGEGFTWGTECGCWERNRAYDTARADDHDHHRRRHRRD